MDCVLVDKITGERQKANISYGELMLIRLLQPVSYILYGLIIATCLFVFAPSSKLSSLILVIAYLINIPMSLSKNGISFVDRIHSILIYPITYLVENREHLRTESSSKTKYLTKGNKLVDFAGILTIELITFSLEQKFNLNTLLTECYEGLIQIIKSYLVGIWYLLQSPKRPS